MHMDKKNPPKAPLWKKIVAILIIVSMPVFFMSYRLFQTQRAANLTEPNTPVSEVPQE